MLKKSRFIFAGIIILVIGMILIAVMNSMRVNMILSMGIIATNNLQATIKWIFTIGGGIVIGFGLFQFIPTAIDKAKQYLVEKKGQSFRLKTSTQEQIREQLLFMKSSNKMLSGDIDDCLGQLDRFNNIMSRFDRLITTNSADQVAGSRVGLEEIGQTLNVNFKWVINSSIAAGDDTSDCHRKICRAIESNNAILSKGDDFLSELADNISSDLASGITIKLDAWMRTLSEQNKNSRILGDENDEN